MVFGKIFTNFNVLAEIGSLSGNPDGNSRIWWQIQQLVLSGSEKLRKEGVWQLGEDGMGDKRNSKYVGRSKENGQEWKSTMYLIFVVA